MPFWVDQKGTCYDWPPWTPGVRPPDWPPISEDPKVWLALEEEPQYSDGRCVSLESKLDELDAVPRGLDDWDGEDWLR